MNLKIKEREKKFLVYGGIAAAIILFYSLFSWYTDLKAEVDEISGTRMYMLEKQLHAIAGKGDLKKKLDILEKKLERQEKSFLQGDTPPVAAAALQKLLKRSASILNIEVKLERTLNPVETGFYLGIPVEIGFTASTDKFKNLLVELRRSSFLLTVTEIKLRVTNISNPKDIFTSLVVTGFIKNPEPEEENSDEAKK